MSRCGDAGGMPTVLLCQRSVHVHRCRGVTPAALAHLVLVEPRRLEVREDEDEDEEVVHGQALLQQVARKELRTGSVGRRDRWRALAGGRRLSPAVSARTPHGAGSAQHARTWTRSAARMLALRADCTHRRVCCSTRTSRASAQRCAVNALPPASAARGLQERKRPLTRTSSAFPGPRTAQMPRLNAAAARTKAATPSPRSVASSTSCRRRRGHAHPPHAQACAGRTDGCTRLAGPQRAHLRPQLVRRALLAA